MEENKIILRRLVIFSVLFSFIFLLFGNFSSAVLFDKSNRLEDSTVNVYQGNLTNLSELQDVNIPSPSDQEVLTYDSASGKWISQSAASVSDTNETTRFDALTSTDCSPGELVIGVQDNGTVLCATDSATTYSSLLNFTNDPNFFNETTVNTTNDFIVSSNILSINWTNAQNIFSSIFDSLFGAKTTDDLTQGSTNLYDNQSWNESWADGKYLQSYTETDPLWTANQSNYYTIAEVENNLSNYYLNSNPNNYYNNTTLQNVSQLTNDAGYLTSAVDTQKAGGSPYLYNDSTTIYLNDTVLNNTIDSRDSDTTYTNGSNLTLTGTTFAVDVSSLQTYFDSIYALVGDVFSGSWNDLTDVPAGFADGVDNDTASSLTHLSNFTDDLGNRGYTSNTNFTNDNNYWNDTYATFNKTYADTLYADISQTDTNVLTDGTYNTTELEEQTGTILGINKTWLNSYINGFGFLTTISNIFDQSLNTTDDVTFRNITSNNITADYFFGDGSQLTNLPAGTETDPHWTANQSNYYTIAEIENNLSNYYLNSNPNNYWNDTYATFNKTYADTLYQVIGNYLTSAVELLQSGDNYVVFNDSTGAVQATLNETKLNETIDLRTAGITDTNASTACSAEEVLLGNGSCYDSNNFFDDTTNANQTISYNASTDEITLDGGGGTIDISEVDTDTTCANDGSCSNITYNSDTTNWDKDSSDDLTTSTNFGGDVSGVYNDIQISTDSIGANELNESNISNANFINDAGYLTSAVDTQKAGGSPYLYNDSTTIYLNDTVLNNTIDLRDSDTTYTNGSGISLVGTEFNHSDTSSVSDSDNSGNTFIQDLTFDTFGHVLTVVTGAVDFSSYFTSAQILGFNYFNLTNFPYTHLSNFTNDLSFVSNGDSGITLNFTNIYSDDWSNVSITESQISDLTHTTDTNASTACADGEYLDGSGSCINLNNTIDSRDSDTTYTAGNGIALSGTEFSVSAGSGLTQDASGLSVTADGIGNTQLAFDTGQALTTSSNPTFNNLTVTNLVLSNSASHFISDNSTCTKIYGSTSILEVC